MNLINSRVLGWGGGGKWSKSELQRLCHMAHSLPTSGQWHAFYARLIRLISIYGDRKDDAGRFARGILPFTYAHRYIH
jgi:hypothetical protein